MDGCNYEEAFPTGPVGSPGCLDRVSPDESRRQEKKKARRCRGPQATYLNNGYNMVGPLDPDRPSTKRMEPFPALNTATGLREHAPVTQQYNYDTFVGSMDSLPAIRANVEGVDKLQKESAPSFFGASPEDTPASLVGKRTSGNGITESFQSFVNVIGEDDSYMLKPDFTKSFETSGAQKAGGVGISSGSSPIFSSAQWKPVHVTSLFLKSLSDIGKCRNQIGVKSLCANFFNFSLCLILATSSVDFLM
jgi:hypothetical protein